MAHSQRTDDCRIISSLYTTSTQSQQTYTKTDTIVGQRTTSCHGNDMTCHREPGLAMGALAKQTTNTIPYDSVQAARTCRSAHPLPCFNYVPCRYLYTGTRNSTILRHDNSPQHITLACRYAEEFTLRYTGVVT
jgi:hypothetical protein